MAIFWIIAMVLLMIIEAVTMGLTTIWFACGALVAFIACMIGAGLALQLILFVAASLIVLLLVRPMASKALKGEKTPTNVESLIGQEARVTERIDNRAETGNAVLAGQPWMARSINDDEVLEPGEIVTVKEIRGVKLIVERK